MMLRRLSRQAFEEEKLQGEILPGGMEFLRGEVTSGTLEEKYVNCFGQCIKFVLGSSR